MAHQNEVPSFGDIRGSRPEDITQWVKLVGAGSSKCHGSNIHGNTPSNQCARSVLVSFMSVSLLIVYYHVYWTRDIFGSRHPLISPTVLCPPAPAPQKATAPAKATNRRAPHALKSISSTETNRLGLKCLGLLNNGYIQGCPKPDRQQMLQCWSS